MSTLKVNQIEPRTGGDVTIGESGGTVTLATGATAVGFGSTYAAEIQHALAEIESLKSRVAALEEPQ